MEDQKERLTTAISTAELERRWKVTREMMHDRRIDFLLTRNDEEFLGGYVKWFTDIPARNSYPHTVVFPADEEMTVITPGPSAPAEPFLKDWCLRGVKRSLSAPFFASAHYTSPYEAELAVRVLKDEKGATVGLVGRSFIPVNFFEYLTKHLPGVSFVDATDEVDQIKAVKSPEEIELIKRNAAIQDVAMERVKESIRPGRRDFEIFAEAQYSVVMQGSEQQLILVGSAPAGTPARWQFRHFQNRVMREGDQVSVLIETNGPGGFYTEIGRLFSIGKPSQEWQDTLSVAVEAQEVTLNLLGPGASPKDISEANNAFLEKKGYRPERRLYAHGQGYDLVERPLIRDDEPMEIKAGMNITVHPFAIRESLWANVCDNYLITRTGVSPCLHKTPKEIIVVWP